MLPNSCFGCQKTIPFSRLYCDDCLKKFEQKAGSFKKKVFSE